MPTESTRRDNGAPSKEEADDVYTLQRTAVRARDSVRFNAKGALRHYTIAANGWVRIEDPNAGIVLIIKPDLGKSFVIDVGAKTVRVGTYALPASPAKNANATLSGPAALADAIEPLGEMTLDGIQAAGYRTRSTMRITGNAAGCPDTTITSTRVEYFAPYRIASGVANALPETQSPDAAGCEPAASVTHSGASVPEDRLLVYQANTIEKKSASGTDHYTVVVERGNVHELSAAAVSAFDIPAEFHEVSATSAPPARAASPAIVRVNRTTDAGRMLNFLK